MLLIYLLFAFISSNFVHCEIIRNIDVDPNDYVEIDCGDDCKPHKHKKTVTETVTDTECIMVTKTKTQMEQSTTTEYLVTYFPTTLYELVPETIWSTFTTTSKILSTTTDYKVVTRTEKSTIHETKTILDISKETKTVAKKTILKRTTKTCTETETEVIVKPTTTTSISTFTETFNSTLTDLITQTETDMKTTTITITDPDYTSTVYVWGKLGKKLCAIAGRFGHECETAANDNDAEYYRAKARRQRRDKPERLQNKTPIKVIPSTTTVIHVQATT